jgi:hypothetical protein
VGLELTWKKFNDGMALCANKNTQFYSPVKLNLHSTSATSDMGQLPNNVAHVKQSEFTEKAAFDSLSYM